MLGSGRLLDVPLAALASAFRRVVLVDVLHPLWARLCVRRYSNVELHAADMTGIVAALPRIASMDELPNMRPFAPLHAPDVDFVVSLNVLSQLGAVPVEWLERRFGAPAAPAADGFGAALTRAHLDDLARCRATVCLITDVERLHVAADGAILERDSTIHDMPPPPAAEDWIWPIAPAPENDPTISEHRRVIVSYDPGKDEVPG